jgi:hypothetical protein
VTAVPSVDKQEGDDTGHEETRRDLEDRLRRDVGAEQMAGNVRTARRARGLSDDDHRKEPVSHVLRVDVVGVGPELSHERHVEDADPDVESHPDVRHARRNAGREQFEVDEKKEVHANQQSHAVGFSCKPAVKRHESHEHDRLAGGGVRADLRTTTEQDERLAGRLDDGVTHEEEKHVDEHQQGGCPLSRPHFREQREHAIDTRPALARWS